MMPLARSLPCSTSLSSTMRARFLARSSASLSNSPPRPAKVLTRFTTCDVYSGSSLRDVSSSASHSKLNFFSVVRMRFFLAEKLDCWLTSGPRYRDRSSDASMSCADRLSPVFCCCSPFLPSLPPALPPRPLSRSLRPPSLESRFMDLGPVGTPPPSPPPDLAEFPLAPEDDHSLSASRRLSASSLAFRFFSSSSCLAFSSARRWRSALGMNRGFAAAASAAFFCRRISSISRGIVDSLAAVLPRPLYLSSTVSIYRYA